MKSSIAIAALAFALLAPPAAAADDNAPRTGSAEASTQTVLTDGEVRRVDKAARKITLRHEEIKNLDMPPMTMVFQVKDPAMLDNVKAGDKVKFSAASAEGAMTITEIQVVK